MLALVFSFCSLFSPSADWSQQRTQSLFADSIKRHPKTNPADSSGHFLEVGHVFIIGNRVTRDRIIQRELTLKPGDIVYSSDLASILDLDKKKLFNTRLFNSVELRTLELSPNRVDLLIDVKERWYTFPAPIFELSDRNFNEWWQNYHHNFNRIYYGMRLYQYNMRGRNETLRLTAQFGFQRKFDLLYRFPYIDKKQKQGLTFEAAFQEAKNLAYQTVEHKYQFFQSARVVRYDRSLAITYNYRKTFYKTHSLRLEYRNVHIADTVKLANPNYLHGEDQYVQRYGALTYQFNADHRDYFAYPLKGYQLTASITKTGLGLGDNVNKIEATFLYSRHIALKRKFYLSNSFSAYWSNPQSLSYMNYGALGLRRQFVRGYEVYVIEGPYFGLNKTTFKKLIFSRVYRWNDMPVEQFRHIPISIYLKTYADFGYVKNYPYYEQMHMNTLLTNKLLTGTGFGIDVVGSYDVVLRFEYSFNGLGQHGFFFNLKKEF